MSRDVLTLPQSVEAERAVLGSILLANAALAHVQAVLTAGEFYRTAHGKIFNAMCALADRGEPIDNLTLTEELVRNGHLDLVGGAAYLAELVAAVPSAANVLSHAQIIKDSALRRGIIAAGYDLVQKGYNPELPTQALLEEAEQRVFSITTGSHRGGFHDVPALLRQVTEHVQTLQRGTAEPTGVPTGFIDLDSLTGGWQRSDLVILAARPSMGKTAFALCSALHAAIHHGLSIALFSLEMSARQIITRALSILSGIDMQILRTGRLTHAEWVRYAEAVAQFERTKVFINDAAGLTAQQLRAEAKRLAMRRGLDLLVVDYLQLMQNPHRAENRNLEISEISRSLKVLAKDLNVPVIALSQLNRACEARNDRRPFLSDLRESGSLEQDADLVLCLYRDEVYDPKSHDKGVAELLVRKHRNGPIDELRLAFIAKCARFADLAPQT